jgi:uncharacterized membrane protein YhaH (DUF805 family)
MVSIVGVASLVLDSWLGLLSADNQPFGSAIGGPLSLLSAVVAVPTSLAVTIRRLHDTNRRGWWLLLPVALSAGAFLLLVAAIALSMQVLALALVVALSPFIGALVVFVFLMLDGTPGPNRFGPDPKDPTNADDLVEVFR